MKSTVSKIKINNFLTMRTVGLTIAVINFLTLDKLRALEIPTHKFSLEINN